MSGGGRAPALRWALLGVGVAIALGVFAAAVRAWWFVGDDAYISFRYAEALATRGALEFNPGERVEGYTNFLWVVLLAAGIRLGAAPEVLAPWLGAAMSLAGLGVAAGLGRRLRGVKGPWTALDLAPALLLAVTPEYGVWATSGLEGGTAATLVLESAPSSVSSTAWGGRSRVHWRNRGSSAVSVS
ncbi:MAG TPA: hypothetical protein PKW35_20010 [Nannocystaceae bacterium]|nr:hypothetical protein [Nannocystaceae bacterium]